MILFNRRHDLSRQFCTSSALQSGSALAQQHDVHGGSGSMGCSRGLASFLEVDHSFHSNSHSVRTQGLLAWPPKHRQPQGSHQVDKLCSLALSLGSAPACKPQADPNIAANATSAWHAVKSLSLQNKQATSLVPTPTPPNSVSNVIAAQLHVRVAYVSPASELQRMCNTLTIEFRKCYPTQSQTVPEGEGNRKSKSQTAARGNHQKSSKHRR